MPVRIYDIAKKLGIESKEVLVKAKELGITAARVPSSSLDKITAEYLESHFKPAVVLVSLQKQLCDLVLCALCVGELVRSHHGLAVLAAGDTRVRPTGSAPGTRARTFRSSSPDTENS